MRYWQLNRYVFSCFLNTLSEMSGERSSAGKLSAQTCVLAIMPLPLLDDSFGKSAIVYLFINLK